MMRCIVMRRSTLMTTSHRLLITSAQKRALDKQQLQGKKPSETVPPDPPASKPPPPAATPPPPTTSTTQITSTPTTAGGNNSLLPVAAMVAAGGAAGFYYYYYSSSTSPSGATSVAVSTVETRPPDTSVAETSSPDMPSKEEKEVTTATISEPVNSSSGEAVAGDEAVGQSLTLPSEGNRVASISIPSKMRNVESGTEPVPVPSHPESGHRVHTILPAKMKEKSPMMPEEQSPPPIADKTSTVKALEKLQTTMREEAVESLIRSHQSVWQFRDLDDQNPAELKARIVQLATELQDRTKWEAIRLKEFLIMKEKETEEKYLEILQKQRLEFEDLMARRMREQEHELTLQANKALQEKDANIQSVLGKALELQQNEHETDKKAFEQLKHAEIQVAMEEKYGKMMEEYKAKVAADLQQKVATLNALTQKLRHLESALEASKTSQQGSLKAHRLSAAALSLAEKLETSESAATELAALKAAAGHEGVICTACATIPESVQTTGVLTLAQLQARFSAAQKKCRQAALVPTGRLGLEGQLAGIFLAAIKYPPDPDDPAPESDKDNAEFVLARANRFVQHGELERAVEQLEKLQGQPAFTISDWMKDALDRIAVEKALKVIKMECALLNESCLDD